MPQVYTETRRVACGVDTARPTRTSRLTLPSVHRAGWPARHTEGTHHVIPPGADLPEVWK